MMPWLHRLTITICIRVAITDILTSEQSSSYFELSSQSIQ